MHVALGKVTSLDSLYLIHAFNLSAIEEDPRAINEDQRLLNERQLSTLTILYTSNNSLKITKSVNE